MEKSETICPGCQRPEVHNKCPAWGTRYYRSGELFTKEAEEECASAREEFIEKMKKKYLD